ncbi:accessory gland protein Acp29AB-like [Drosophila eugracilis]|uniref:accessory gland protein Acp29AB-like n=1 Tax=Drosophila eugracilis TaxID=29029 RepID=UPI001BDB48C5|nr:accessory gland protein Acp29AB-like [Drosophila eugracilis]
MLRSTVVFFCTFLVLDPYRSLTQAQDRQRYVCLLSDPPSQCSEYCVSALQPVINHITNRQKDWNTCEVKLNETQETLDRLEEHLVVKQIEAEKQLTSLQANLTQAIPKDLEQRLTLIEANQKDLSRQLFAIKNNTESQLTDMQDTLTKVDRRTMLQNYQRIGTRLFYIEHYLYVDWRTAEKICVEIGGHLAAFKNEQEYNGIAGQLKQQNYWLGINDLAKQGEFISLASGKPATYFQWRWNEPKYDKFDGIDEHCAYIYGVRNYMIVLSCTTDLMHFICQADDEV